MIDRNTQTLTEALYNTVHRGAKALKVIAEEIGVSDSYLTRAALPDHDDCETGTGCRFPLKKLIPLIRSTDDYQVLDAIEASLGRVAITLPIGLASARDICAQSMRSSKEFGELMAAIGTALEDNKLTDAERDHICQVSYKLLAAVSALSAMVRK